MDPDSLPYIFLNACFVNNFVLSLFLGICPFLGVSAKRATAVRMGFAVIFVMLVSSMCAYGINWVLELPWVNAPYLRLIATSRSSRQPCSWWRCSLRKPAPRYSKRWASFCR